jgi:eukaryotic-like serine/threonine-protein kinase
LQPEQWHRVESLYHCAADMDQADRAAFLAHSCAGDESLRREVESLLAHDAAADNFIESPALEVAGRQFAHDLTQPGDYVSFDTETRSIGPYFLVEQIGKGGMGEVWLARQNYPIRRSVALKLIRAGIDTREIVTRFESERQALALMDHPAVAKVFDGGSTLSGRPFFVMEYVPGVPITEWCDEHKLSVRERLELFI